MRHKEQTGSACEITSAQCSEIFYTRKKKKEAEVNINVTR